MMQEPAYRRPTGDCVSLWDGAGGTSSAEELSGDRAFFPRACLHTHQIEQTLLPWLGFRTKILLIFTANHTQVHRAWNNVESERGKWTSLVLASLLFNMLLKLHSEKSMYTSASPCWTWTWLTQGTWAELTPSPSGLKLKSRRLCH